MKEDRLLIGIIVAWYLFSWDAFGVVFADTTSVGLDDNIVFSHEQGFYRHPFVLELSNRLEGSVIRYTTDGSEPVHDSPVYDGGFLLKDLMMSSNQIMRIPTNPEEAPADWKWLPPQRHFLKGFVIKAGCFAGEELVSEIHTKTYFVGMGHETGFRLPVVSLVTDSLNLFGHYHGLYVPGFHFDRDTAWGTPWGNGNYHQRGREWERPASMTFFEADGSIAFQHDVGIRIHGGGSRSLPQKSLRIYARQSYGEENFNYAFFADRDVTNYKRIILRNGGQDFWQGMINDAITHVLVRDLDLERQAYQPVVLYINGEFWGLHNIRDRIDKYYLEYAGGADPDAVDLLSGPGNAEDVKEGDNAHYLQLLRFIESHDVGHPRYFDRVSQMMDVANFIDYNIAKQYIAVYDWPGNNVEYWRPQTDDGRWRWIFYDNDGAMLDAAFDFLAHSTLEGGEDWPNPDWSTFLFRSLLKNNNFRELYIDRFAWHLEHTFCPPRVLGVIDSLVANIEHVVPIHIDRWNYPQDFGYWYSFIDQMREFALLRPCIVREQLIGYFDLDADWYLPDLCKPVSTNTPGGRHTTDMHNANTYQAFPNPVKGGSLFVRYHGYDEQEINITMIDLTGKAVLQKGIVFSAGQTTMLETVGLTPGIYFLVFESDQFDIERQLIILL